MDSRGTVLAPVLAGCLDLSGARRLLDIAAGDLFAELPGGYDVHLFSHVLHDWGEQDVRKALERSFEALPPGGLFVDHDTHINWEKTGPLAVAQ